jgi:propanol-preferring alcohol dehydrogenase
MRAAIPSVGKMEIKDLPKPSLKYEDALVKLSTAGVCHSDLHLAKGDWTGGRVMPMPLGHEGIGIIEELGAGADKSFKVGDRVILGLGGSGGGYWCGACEYCLSGHPRLCKQSKGIMGTFAEYISVFAKSLVKLPPEVPDSEVALACGGLTAFSAIKKLIKFGVAPGKPIAIVGSSGGLGHYAVQIAKAFGYQVVGIDVGAERVEFSKKMGADFAVDAGEAESFIMKQFEGVYSSIVFTPKMSGFQMGLKLMRKGGLFISVGLPAASEGSISISPMELFGREPLIMASAVGNVDEMREVVALAAAGKLKSHIGKSANLSEINDVFEDLAAGKYTGRAIITDMTK